MEDQQRDPVASRGGSTKDERRPQRALSRQQLSDAKNRLILRRNELRTDIQRELRKCDDDRYGTLADRVADPGDASVADVLADLDLGEIDRDVAELRDIEAALARIAAGSYGVCIECGRPIDPARLERLPQVTRDVECQERFERLNRTSATPSL